LIQSHQAAQLSLAHLVPSDANRYANHEAVEGVDVAQRLAATDHREKGLLREILDVERAAERARENPADQARIPIEQLRDRRGPALDDLAHQNAVRLSIPR